MNMSCPWRNVCTACLQLNRLQTIMPERTEIMIARQRQQWELHSLVQHGPQLTQCHLSHLGIDDHKLWKLATWFRKAQSPLVSSANQLVNFPGHLLPPGVCIGAWRQRGSSALGYFVSSYSLYQHLLVYILYGSWLRGIEVRGSYICKIDRITIIYI